MLGLFTHLTRRLGMGYLCSNIDIWDEKKKKIETLNSENRLKKEAFTYMSLFLGKPHPSPEQFPTFLPSGAWAPGETKMAPYDSALVQLTSNESTDSARTHLGISVQ